MTIDRPERRNALTSNMYFGIRRAVDRVNASPSLHAPGGASPPPKQNGTGWSRA